VLLVSFFLGGAAGAPAKGPEGYLMHPDTDGKRVAFSAENDLWIAPFEGGVASRLTAGSGKEIWPKFSPTGDRLAFLGDYEGGNDIYLLHLDGGTPQRLTFGPGSEVPLCWHVDADKKEWIVYRENIPPHYRGSIKKVALTGGMPVDLPMGTAATFALHTDGNTVVYNDTNRVNATWKRYGGGTNDNLFLGDLAKGTFKQLTEFHGADAYPMWVGERIYFITDRSGIMNVWSMTKDGSDLKQHSKHDKTDVRHPSIKGTTIVYSNFGDVWAFDTKTDASKKIEITLPSDRRLSMDRGFDPGDYVDVFDLNKEGDRIVIGTRGDVVAMDPKRGPIKRMSTGEDVRDRAPVYSPKGDQIALWSNRSGSEELWLLPTGAEGEPKQLTNDSSEWHMMPEWSPDGKKIAWADSLMRVRFIDVESGAITEVASSPVGETNDYSWSPDSRWLAYTFPNHAFVNQIHIYDTQDKVSKPASSVLFSCYEPTWSRDGKYLFFLSNREVAPVFDNFTFQVAATDATKPFVMLLNKDVESFLTAPEFLPKKDKKDKDDAKGDDDDEEDSDEDSDDDDKDGDKKDGDKKDEEDEEEEIEPVVIDFDNLDARTFPLPLPAGNYHGVTASEKNLFVISVPTQRMTEFDELFGEDKSPKNSLQSYAFGAEKFDDRKVEQWIGGITNYDLSDDGKQILYLVGSEMYLVGSDGKVSENEDKTKVQLGRLKGIINPAREWAQILADAYFQNREFFIDPKMGGLDWKATYERYKALLPRIATRQELNDLLGQFIGELGVGHTYVWQQGDLESEHGGNINIGTLGAKWAWDAAKNAYKFTTIYQGYPWMGSMTSPLNAPHAKVSVGSYMHAIDGEKLTADVDPFKFLRGKAGQAVELTVSDDGDAASARTIIVQALGGDGNLPYIDWVESRRKYTEEKSGGKLGYLHIPDMQGHGTVMFMRYFYPQLDKDGIVVDARYNGGGFTSQLLLERLMKKPIAYGTKRNMKDNWSYPDASVQGALVVLTNEYAGSDGDIFPEAVQLTGLAKTVGTRTWGGVWGIRGDKPFTDNGMITTPEFGWWDTRRGWALENEGHTPDVIVPYTAEDELADRDPQLDKGIEILMEQVKAGKTKRPTPPPMPNKLDDWKRRAAPFQTKP